MSEIQLKLGDMLNIRIWQTKGGIIGEREWYVVQVLEIGKKF